MCPLPGIPSGHNPPVFLRAIVQRMSLRTSVATLVWPPPGIPSGHNLFSYQNMPRKSEFQAGVYTGLE